MQDAAILSPIFRISSQSLSLILLPKLVSGGHDSSLQGREVRTEKFHPETFALRLPSSRNIRCGNKKYPRGCSSGFLIDDDDMRRPFGCQRRKLSGISVFGVGLWLLLARGLESSIGRYKEAEPTGSVDWSRACRLTEPYRDVEAMLRFKLRIRAAGQILNGRHLQTALRLCAVGVPFMWLSPMRWPPTELKRKKGGLPSTACTTIFVTRQR